MTNLVWSFVFFKAWPPITWYFVRRNSAIVLFSSHSQRLIDSNAVFRERERDLSCWSRSIFILQNCGSTTRSRDRPSRVPVEADDDGSLLWIFQHSCAYSILKTLVDGPLRPHAFRQVGQAFSRNVSIFKAVEANNSSRCTEESIVQTTPILGSNYADLYSNGIRILQLRSRLATN